MFENISYCL